MANVLIFEAGKEPQYLLSVNEPDYCVSVPPTKFVAQDYAKPGVLINPDLSALKDVPKKYWKQSGTDVYKRQQ